MVMAMNNTKWSVKANIFIPTFFKNIVIITFIDYHSVIYVYVVHIHDLSWNICWLKL